MMCEAKDDNFEHIEVSKAVGADGEGADTKTCLVM